MFSQKGFTLLEVTIAILIISLSLLSVYGFFSYITFQTNLASSKLTAFYLSQEGLEIVRNIRDGNLLNNVSWSANLAPGQYEAGYSGYLGDALTLIQGNLKYLKKEDNGFYNYNSGSETKFTRKISITMETDSKDLPCIKVVSRVDWNEKSKAYFVSVLEKIYDLQN